MGDYWCYTFWKNGYDSDLILGLVGHLPFDTFEEEGKKLKSYKIFAFSLSLWDLFV